MFPLPLSSLAVRNLDMHNSCQAYQVPALMRADVVGLQPTPSAGEVVHPLALTASTVCNLQYYYVRYLLQQLGNSKCLSNANQHVMAVRGLAMQGRG